MSASEQPIAEEMCIYPIYVVENEILTINAKNHCVNRDWLEEYVLKIVDNYISHLSHKQQHCIYKLCLERVENSHQSEIEVLKKEVRNIDKELFRIADVITIASSSTLIEKLTSLEQQKAEIQLQIENLAKKEKRKSLSEQEIGLFFDKLQKNVKKRGQLLT